MRIAIFSATPARLARIFVERRGPELGRHGIEIGLVVEDCNASKSEAFLRHALTIARRQARLAGCTTATAALRRCHCRRSSARLR